MANRMHFSVWSGVGNGLRFRKLLEQSAKDVRAILES